MDWRAVGAGALWVVGLGIVLAAVSYTSWAVSVRRVPVSLRQALGRPAFTVAFDLGLALVCAGLALAGREWWEQLAWAVLAALFAIQGGYAGWQVRSHLAAPTPASRRESDDRV